jgi:hypothetical protein
MIGIRTELPEGQDLCRTGIVLNDMYWGMHSPQATLTLHRLFVRGGTV